MKEEMESIDSTLETLKVIEMNAGRSHRNEWVGSLVELSAFELYTM